MGAPYETGGLALVMSGGGARAAYQVGFLCHLAQAHPQLRIPILTGVSAGAINAAFLANATGDLGSRVRRLEQLWSTLEVENVFRVGALGLYTRAFRWGLRLISGGRVGTERTGGMVDTEPLRQLLSEVLGEVDGRLPGIEANLSNGNLEALAILTASYTTGQSVAWVEGRTIQHWERANRISRACHMGVAQIMASAALPLFFPGVAIENAWYGDGGMRMTAPLSPAIHLGADRIIAISTRYTASTEEARAPVISGYPPPAQVAGLILNSIFLDQFDADALRLQRINRLLDMVPEGKDPLLRKIDLLVLRPSQDLGKLANAYEAQLPGSFRHLTRGLGTKRTSSNDFLSLVMFQHDYLERLLQLGQEDAEARSAEIDAFLARGSN